MSGNQFNVIFDMDGVIFDSERTLMECWLETGVRYGVDEALVHAVYLDCIGRNQRQTMEIYRRAFQPVIGERTQQLWDDSVALHNERYADGRLPLKAGVRALLTYLKESGIPAGIASSSRLQTVEKQIDAAGLSGYFIGLIGGDAVKISKPAPEIYQLACERFGFPPEITFAVEDSFNGIRSASGAGLRAIMVPDIVPPDAEMRALAETVCADLFAVRDYFKRMMDCE